VSRSDEQRAADILDAADQIAGVVKEGHEVWDTDRPSTGGRALLEIIGEPANALSDQASTAPSPSANMASLRSLARIRSEDKDLFIRTRRVITFIT
jgi:hypothetical protein